MSSNFREKIYNIISEQLGVDKERITPEAHFAADLNAGGLEMEELTTRVENGFGIQLDRRQIKEADTIDDFVHLVFDRLDGLLEEEGKTK